VGGLRVRDFRDGEVLDEGGEAVELVLILLPAKFGVLEDSHSRS